ncbi:MAG: CRISPR-associated endoribonuclease Cas6 [Chitinophagales bacterium]
MRIHLKLTSNTENVPFNYQGHLVQKFHEWVGENEIHDGLSLYSLSWLWGNVHKSKNSLNFREGATWLISAYDDALIRQVVNGIMGDGSVAFGMSVESISLQQTPDFSGKAAFRVASPVFIKRTVGEEQQYYYAKDDEANELLTETLQHKLEKANLNPDVRVSFDDTYRKPAIKGMVYKGQRMKGSICPVIVEGSAEAVAFAWNVGVGNGTGIGFGSLV